MSEGIERISGDGWLVLLGGGEFSFGETAEADERWLALAGPGPVGFLPAASGSVDYAGHFAAYLAESFDRDVETVPVYRARDARRGKNAGRVREMATVYLGGGVPDHLLDALAGTPVAEAVQEKLERGGVVVAIAAAAQAVGQVAWSLVKRGPLPGLGWLPGGVVEPNFDPDHDRRLRRLLAQPGARWGVGIPAESALLLGPGGAVETVGPVFRLADPEGEVEEMETDPPPL